MAVGLFDITPRALSAIFFYYNPDYARLSPGTANVVSLLRDAVAAELPYIYLGYRVAGCPSLRYKASFRPHELLEGRPETLGDPPRWRGVEGGKDLSLTE